MLLHANPSVCEESTPLRLYVNYALKPDLRDLQAHDVCILDPAAEVDLASGQSEGRRFLAYVSTVEVAEGSPAARAAVARGVPVVGQNETWKSALLDVTHPEWARWLIDDIAAAALDKGYDGLFLDTADSAERLAGTDPARQAVVRSALIAGIRRLHSRFPDKQLVINRGFSLIPELRDCLDGVLIESVFRTWSEERHAYVAVPEEGTSWLLQRISELKARGLPVYVLDYAPPDDAALARNTAERIAQLGCVPFVSTPDLQGQVLAPLREIPRRILILHGWKPSDHPQPAFAADTITSELLQMPLEWLGCEVEFHNAGQSVPPDLSPVRYRGILLDEALHLPVEQEDAFADWLLAQQRRGIRLLFTGMIPFTRENVKNRILSSLGLGGDYFPTRLLGRPNVVTIDKSVMNAEAEVAPTTADFRPLTAPRGSRVLLGLQAEDVSGRTLRTDPVFLASWGGALLQPYIVLRGMADQRFCYTDLYVFLSAWLGLDVAPFPVPDVTTQNGLRLFYSHIDGDGFVSRSALKGNPLCGEAIRDHVLKKFAYPVTVSVVEAEIEAHVVGLDLSQVPRYREAARSVFALPNIQAASHAYSHPFRWLDFDPADETKYPSRALVLHPWANYGDTVDAEREVCGSIDYINRTLLPEGKKVELFLWSGNCRPGAEALRQCAKAGVENMNGGTTVLSRLYPGIVGVAPRHVFWDGEMQIFASNQNEFMYANGWKGPFYGGFANLIDTFERTEKPRRLKPVNVYYHFYSATYLSSLRALEKILQWCSEQPLHAVTAKEYAALVRDAYATRIYDVAPRQWLISHTGALRTFRLPSGAGLPDMTRCRNVTGYVLHADFLYFHTTGDPLAEVVLADKPPRHLRLATCTGAIAFHSLSMDRAYFKVNGSQPVRATFAGAPRGAEGELLVNGAMEHIMANDAGEVSLSLPTSAEVVLDFSAIGHAN
ncbi:MAG: endo alpha-1,4 polygalactosaminidase [Roseimicrobium sp.]